MMNVKRLWSTALTSTDSSRCSYSSLRTDANFAYFSKTQCQKQLATAEQIAMKLKIVDGNLLDQPVEVIVNAWNRNIIPWWLLIPQGVAGAIKKSAGIGPFVEVARAGPIPLGEAVLTSSGRLPFRGIIHVAGINMLWRSSEKSIRNSVQNAMHIVIKENFQSVAFPLIGAGSGGGSPSKVQDFIIDELSKISYQGEVYLVRYSRH